MTLRRGQLLHVVVRQLGADAALALYDPAGRDVLDVDSPNSETGVENLYFVAVRDGRHGIEVHQRSAAPGGRYTVDIGAPRRPTTGDRTRAAACRLKSDADAALAASAPAARRRALDLYRRAARLWRGLGDDAAAALVETDLGNAAFALDDTRAALAAWQRAAALLRGSGKAGTLPALDNDLGSAAERRGATSQARAAYDAALASARRLGDRAEEITALNHLGRLEQSAGAPWEALVRLDEALALARAADEPDGAASTLENQGRLYTVLGKLDEAADALTQAVALDRAAVNRGEEATATMALGWVRFLAGDAPAARTALLDALAQKQAAGDPNGAAEVLDRLGSLARDSGAPAEAIAHYRQALAVFRADDDPRAAADTLNNLALAETLAGDAAAGLRSAREAVRRAAALSEASAEAYAHFRCARAERALGRLAAARQDMEAGLSLLDSIRNRTQSDDLRMSYVDSIHDQYELLVDLLMDLHASDPAHGWDRTALAAAERGRARGLLDLVAAARRQGEGRDAAALARLRAVDERIRAAEIAGPGALDAVPLAADGTRPLPGLRALLAERQAIQVAIRRGETDRPHVLGVDEIQRQVLDRDTVLLVYSLGERRSFVWSVTRDRVISAILPPRATLEAAALGLHDLVVDSRRYGPDSPPRRAARQLSRLLLAPVAASLAGRRVAVMADGALAYVPFGALPAPETGGDGDAPLLANHEMVVLPSASVVAAIRRRGARRRPSPKLLAVVADPDVGSGADTAGSPLLADGHAAGEAAATRSLHDLGLGRIEPLPWSRREAAAILGLVPAAERLGAVGAGASRALVLDGSLEPYRIVHFAAHALIHPRIPELSGILLAAVDERGRPRPGFLQSFEIAELHLPADLVVLSACSTGLGRALKGEGLVGLTQSFFHAGAARVVVSLWDVGDRATAEMMTLFYRELLRGRRAPAAALRAAQLAMSQEPGREAPYYWAGFELQGDWRPLD